MHAKIFLSILLLNVTLSAFGSEPMAVHRDEQYTLSKISASKIEMFENKYRFRNFEAFRLSFELPAFVGWFPFSAARCFFGGGKPVQATPLTVVANAPMSIITGPVGTTVGLLAGGCKEITTSVPKWRARERLKAELVANFTKAHDMFVDQNLSTLYAISIGSRDMGQTMWEKVAASKSVAYLYDDTIAQYHQDAYQRCFSWSEADTKRKLKYFVSAWAGSGIVFNPERFVKFAALIPKAPHWDQAFHREVVYLIIVTDPQWKYIFRDRINW